MKTTGLHPQMHLRSETTSSSAQLGSETSRSPKGSGQGRVQERGKWAGQGYGSASEVCSYFLSRHCRKVQPPANQATEKMWNLEPYAIFHKTVLLFRQSTVPRHFCLVAPLLLLQGHREHVREDAHIRLPPTRGSDRRKGCDSRPPCKK